MELFATHKITIVKEESESSDTNQAYDQLQAVADKQSMRQLLDIARSKVNGRMDQNKLVAIISIALKDLPGTLWKNSFIRVNLHPHHRLSFGKWIEKIFDKVHTGETKYYRTNEHSYYDAMPAVWKRVTVERRRELLALIDLFADDSNVLNWTKENCLKLLPFCKLQDIPKLRICHKVAREKDSGVIDGRRIFIATDGEGEEEGEGSVEEVESAFDEVEEDDLTVVGGDSRYEDENDVMSARTAVENRKQQTALDSFMFKPHSMTVEDYSINKKAQEDLFCHMLNFGARSE